MEKYEALDRRKFLAAAGVAMDVSVHVHRNSLAEVVLRSDAIDALLHLAMTTVPALYRIRGCGQQAVIQKRQGLLQVGREQLAQGLAEGLEAADPSP